jgi:hypothetical protein
MRTFDELVAVLGELKGARASVMWALSMAGRPLSQGELLVLTGYSRKPVRRAVRELLAQGAIRHDGPRVLALSDDWPYRVVKKAPGQDRAVPARPAATHWAGETAERDADESPPAAPGEWAAAPAEYPAAPGRPDGGTGTLIPPTDELAGRLAQSDREERLRQELEDRRRAFLAGRLAVATSQLAADTAGTTGGGLMAPAGETNGPESGPSGRQTPYVVVDPDPDQSSDQQQQQIPDGAGPLAALLRRMGINGRAFWRLVRRQDLAARPEVVLAWWWYYRVQEGVRNPAGAAISRLDVRDRPPGGYLALAQLWPAMDGDVRQELESLVLHNWSAEQIAARLRPECPGLTAGAVLAFMSLSLEELDG